MQSHSIKLIPKKLPKLNSSFNRQISTGLTQLSNTNQGSIFDQYKKYQTSNNTEDAEKKEDFNTGNLLPSKSFQVANVLFKQQGLSSSSVEDFKQAMDLVTKLLPIKENENKEVNVAEIEKQVLELCGGHAETLYKFGNVALQLVRLTGNTLGSTIALKMYEISYKNGYQNAQYTYANLLHDGFKGIERNIELSQNMMKELADTGNPLALTKYAAWMIEAKDFSTAIKYLEKGSESGWAQASIHLGHLYRLGNGVKEDIDTAISYYQRAIDQKEIAQSHFYLGRCYAIHPTPNHEMSFKHYRIAAKQGLPEAQYNVGFCYNSGLGTKKDFTLAAEYYQMASMQKFSLAMINLAKLYLNGGGEEDPNFQKDPWKGVHLLKEAAKSKGPLGEDAQSILDSIDFDSLPKQTDKDGKCSIM